MTFFKHILFFITLLHITFLQSQQITNSNSDTQLNLKLSGRILYDFEFLYQKISPENYSVNAQEFRQIFLGANGSISENLKFKTEFDFSGGKIGMRDIYIRITDLPLIKGNLTIGNQAEPTGLDMLTGNNFIAFLERTPMTATQYFRWNTGFGYENFNVFQKHIGIQLMYGFNGNKDEAFTDLNLENGSNLIGRAFYPIFLNSNKNQFLHLGTHFELRKRTKEPTDYNLKFRPENHLGEQISLTFTGLKNQQDIGFEFVTKLNDFYVQSEYEISGYHTKTEKYRLKSYYVMVSKFLTQDHKEYKDGVMGKVTPKNSLNFSEKKLGAVEVVARYSGFDYSDVITTGNNDGVNSLALGLNWYLNSNARIMYNYVLSNLHQSGDNPKLNAQLIRFQVYF